jgi:putative ABC transport system ATP-binding protein
MALIETVNLTKNFFSQSGEVTTHALSGISFKVEEGEFTAIMGQSGSGKSTLLHVLGLLIEPTGGEYWLDGVNTTKFSEAERAHLRNRRLGFVFQAFHLLARASVLENVLLPLTYSQLPTAEYRPRALEALEQVGLTHRLHHQPDELSGGEKQRVAIARALVMKPRVLFADEPTGNLDSRNGAAVMELLNTLHRAGHTIIVITHETVTARYAHRLITLHDGVIAADEARPSALNEAYQK